MSNNKLAFVLMSCSFFSSPALSDNIFHMFDKDLQVSAKIASDLPTDYSDFTGDWQGYCVYYSGDSLPFSIKIRNDAQDIFLDDQHLRINQINTVKEYKDSYTHIKPKWNGNADELTLHSLRLWDEKSSIMSAFLSKTIFSKQGNSLIIQAEASLYEYNYDLETASVYDSYHCQMWLTKAMTG